jgi:hypothetical protein
LSQGLDALSEVRREATQRQTTTGDADVEGVLAAHAPPRERAAMIEHASGFKMKPETLAPWEPDNLVRSRFYRSLTTAILALNDEATRNGLFHELKLAPLRLSPTLDRDAPDAGRVEAVPQETLRTIWLTSLRDLDMERPDVCRWLTYYAPVARSLMPPGTAQRVATEIMELGDWWP